MSTRDRAQHRRPDAQQLDARGDAETTLPLGIARVGKRTQVRDDRSCHIRLRSWVGRDRWARRAERTVRRSVPTTNLIRETQSLSRRGHDRARCARTAAARSASTGMVFSSERQGSVTLRP